MGADRSSLAYGDLDVGVARAIGQERALVDGEGSHAGMQRGMRCV